MGPRVRDAMLVAAVSGVTTLNVFFQGALTAALPTIGSQLHFKQADLQWPNNVYALSFGCFLLPFGRLADIIGGRTLFLAGSAWFALWSLATAFAPNPPTLIVFVALKGLGAAANTPAGVGLLSARFPPGPRRSNAFGALAAGQPVGFIMGLILGGILTDTRATWRAIFYVQAALGLVFVALGFAFIPHIRTSPPSSLQRGFDWVGMVLSVSGLGLMTYSLADSTTARRGWATPQIPSLFSVSVLLLGAFVWHSRRLGERALVPPNMWRKPGAKLGRVLSVLFLGWWSFNATIYFLTLYYQQVLQLNALSTALRFVPMALAGFVVNIVSGWAASRASGWVVIIIGLSGNIAAATIFALIDVRASYWAMAFPIMILVVGADAAYPIGNLQIVAHFDEDSQSLAGSVFGVTTRLGTSLGLAVTSSIATATTASHADASSPQGLLAGFRAAAWACAGTAALGAVVCAVGLRGIGVVGREAEKGAGEVQLGMELRDVDRQGRVAEKLTVRDGAGGSSTTVPAT